MKQLRCIALSLVLIIVSGSVFSQTRTVKGKVTDATNQHPLAGATIQAIGAVSGTQTEEDGSFTLQLPSRITKLSVTYVGYDSKEVLIGSDDLNIALSPQVKQLDTLVVIGYGTQKKNTVTSSIVSVKPEAFNAGGSRSPLDLIQGKVAGLTLTRTSGGNPNSGISLQLRGVNALDLDGTGGKSTPLIVIDGIPGGNLDLLQQDEIASFDILKDGSAAAIYGSRANGGVILITTKKGHSTNGKPQFEYSGYLQHDVVDKRPDVLSADEYRKWMNNPAYDLGGHVDLYDLLLNKDNLSQYHSFSATGGSATSNYRATIYYNEANGIAKENGRKQYGGRINVNQKGLKDRLTLQTTVAVNFNKANMLGGDDGDFEQAIQRNPTAPITNADGSYVETKAYNNYNPVARLNQQLYERDQQTFSGDAKLSYNIYKGLRASAFGAIIKDVWNERQYYMRNSYESVQNYQGMGYAYKGNRIDFDKLFEATLDYSGRIAQDHSIAAVAGYSYQYHTYEEYHVANSGFLTDAFQDWNIGNGVANNTPTMERPDLYSHKEDNTLIAFFGRVTYDYKQKYMAQFSLRHEGSTRFGKNNQWGNFPAVSVGWSITKESFMQSIGWLNDLKLRAGYGVTGNQQFNNYIPIPLLGTGGQYLQDGLWFQTYGLTKNTNPDLRWEQKQEVNLGIDFSVLKGRLGGSIDLFSRKTKDLIARFNVPLPSNLRDQTILNVGSIENKGIEVTINAVPIKQKDFQWTTDFTWSTLKNKLVSLAIGNLSIGYIEKGGLPSPGNLGNAIRIYPGGELGTFYGYRYAGLTDDGMWQFYKKDGSIVTAKDISSTDDKFNIGNGIPKMMASLTNTFRYKRFDLTVFLRGKFKFDILNEPNMYFGNQQWKPNNVLAVALTKYAKLKDAPAYSDYYLEKGGFVKLDNVTLGYTFKLKTDYIRSLRAYIAGRNLATFTQYSGLDPELQDTGLETGLDTRGFYPRTRSYTLGVSLGF